ncbi:MAG TPA: PucR family transcriptional regulator ligand-binding domain-containing protein [Anaerolineaceae bacterium]|nr:PucR family transcriptional regulator ligand-binding domain-containing protein [Anaerolineaceae bacterium]
MELTIREALQIGPLSQARVVAGQNGLDRVIRSVTMMEAPDILDWSHPGDFLVTTSYPLLDRAIPEQEFIPKLYEKGIIGLAAKLHAFLKEYPPSMIREANRLGFPLIDIPTKHSLMEIIQPLTNEILERRTAELIQSQNIQRQFINLVLSGGGFNEIAQAISQLVNYPVSIVDRIGKIIGNSLILGDNHTFEEFINTERKDEKYLAPNYSPEVIETWEKREIKHVVAQGQNASTEFMVCPINIGSFQLGQVIVWGVLDPEKNSTDSIAMEHGAVIAALKLMEQRSLYQVQERFRKEILEGLLSKQVNARKRAINELCKSEGNPDPPFVILFISPDKIDEKILNRFEQNNINESLYLVKQHLQMLNHNAIFWDQGTNLVVCYPLHQSESSDPAYLNGELTKIVEILKTHNQPYTVSMGVSSPVSSFDDFHRAYDYAKQSFHIGQILQPNSIGHVTNYEDLGIFKIVATFSDSETIEEFCQDAIGPLIKNDQEYGTELLKTLEVYFEQDLNVAQAAKRLFIHYNTMRYRLDCIEELLGYSLKNAQKRITLEVAIHLYPLMNRDHSR